MDLLALITGATEAIAAKTAGVNSAMDSFYADSPFAKIEEAFQGAEDKMLDSPMHRAFAGGDFGSGNHGASDYTSIGLENSLGNSGYVDATAGLQGVMSQAGIMNPASSQLQGGLPVMPSAPPSLQAGNAAPVPGYLKEYEDKLASVPDAPPVPEIIEETTPALIDKDEDLIKAGKLAE